MYVINKSSKTIEQTDNQNNYPENAYLKMPENWTPPTCEHKYLKWNAEETDLEEMTAEEKETVDNTEITEAKASKITEMKNSASKELSETDWKVIRHRDQLAGEQETSLTSEEYNTLLIERNNIRIKSNNREDSINNCTTLGQISDVVW